MTDEASGTGGAKRERGHSVVLYLKPSVVAALDAVAEAQQRSRSFIANACLAERLGVLAPEAGKRWEDEEL